MADKPIGFLPPAEQVGLSDLFVMEQNDEAKSVSGQVLQNWLLAMAEGHGGIRTIEQVSTVGLKDTYRITLADETTFDYVVTNARSIQDIRKTSTSGLVDTYTITYNDGTAETYSVTNGAKGDPGDYGHVWIKYASQEPSADESFAMSDIPDEWIGIFAGTANTVEPPDDWTMYTWYKHKGKSAYEYALEGGYTGTEQQFTARLAGTARDVFWAHYGQTTFEQIRAAHSNGSLCVCVDGNGRVVPLYQIVDGTARFSLFNQYIGAIVYSVSMEGVWSQDVREYEQEDDIFVAIYGVTSGGEIYSARMEGKVCFCKMSNYEPILPLTYFDSSRIAKFTAHCGGYIRQWTVEGNQWTESYEYRTKASEISSGSTDDEIPTAKAVYDYVNSLLGT